MSRGLVGSGILILILDRWTGQNNYDVGKVTVSVVD